MTYRFNFALIPAFDSTRTAMSHKYGNQTMPKPHQCLAEQNITTVERESFRKPQQRIKAHHRHASTLVESKFDDSMIENPRLHADGKAAASGFAQSLLQCDGKTWVPEKNSHTDQLRTEYRNRFNYVKNFHKSTLRESIYLLPRKALVYDKEDKN